MGKGGGVEGWEKEGKKGGKGGGRVVIRYAYVHNWLRAAKYINH